VDGSTAHFYDGALLSQTQPAAQPRHGSFCRVINEKLYWTDGPLLHFSDVDSPGTDSDSTTTPGGGFINVAKQDSDGEDALACEVYYSTVAVFSRLLVQIWALQADPTKNAIQQKLRVGTAGARTVLQFGTGDVMFLADSGIRSLRAMTYTLAASLEDVGSPIDKLVVASIAGLVDPNDPLANAIVQPISGRYWCQIGTTVYVLSFFPSAKISAWSQWDLTFAPTALTRVQNRVYAWDGGNGNLYLYGGNDNATYGNDYLVEIITPYYSHNSPDQTKLASYVEVNCQGTWNLQGGMNPGVIGVYDTIGTVTAETYSENKIGWPGAGTHFGFRLTHQGDGYAALSALAVGVRYGST